MRKSWIAATGMMAGMAALAGCSDDNNGAANDTDGGQAVSLASSDDVLREVGNLGSSIGLELGSLIFAPSGGGNTPDAVRMRARLAAAVAPRAATPVSSACSGGGTDTRTADNKSRSFSYFDFSGAVSYQLDAYSNCVSSSNGTTQTVDGSVETGGGNGINWIYTVLGTGQTSMHQITSNDGGSLDRGLLGSVEGKMDGNSDRMRAVLQGTGNSQSGNNKESWQMSLGEDGTPYEMLLTTSDLSFSGPYTYSGSAQGCRGGRVTVDTPSPLVLQSDSGNSFSGGTLTFSSGGKSVTLTMNSDGSATLGGNVSGSLSKDQISKALQGSACVPVIVQS